MKKVFYVEATRTVPCCGCVLAESEADAARQVELDPHLLDEDDSSDADVRVRVDGVFPPDPPDLAGDDVQQAVRRLMEAEFPEASREEIDRKVERLLQFVRAADFSDGVRVILTFDNADAAAAVTEEDVEAAALAARAAVFRHRRKLAALVLAGKGAIFGRRLAATGAADGSCAHEPPAPAGANEADAAVAEPSAARRAGGDPCNE
jgi:hypothetical protein